MVRFEASEPVGVNDLYQPGWKGFGLATRRPAIRKSARGEAFCHRLLVAARHAWRGMRRAMGGDAKERRPVSVTVHVAFPTFASDIDGPLKPILDSLQHAGIVVNDNRVDELHVYRLPPDRERPRVEVEVREVA